jgi:hypothetical protein
LKKWWCIFWKFLNSKVDRTTWITIIYQVFFTNCCEMWGASKFGLTNVKTKNENLIEFGMNRLPIIKEERLQKKKVKY